MSRTTASSDARGIFATRESSSRSFAEFMAMVTSSAQAQASYVAERCYGALKFGFTAAENSNLDTEVFLIALLRVTATRRPDGPCAKR